MVNIEYYVIDEDHYKLISKIYYGDGPFKTYKEAKKALNERVFKKDLSIIKIKYKEVKK